MRSLLHKISLQKRWFLWMAFGLFIAFVPIPAGSAAPQERVIRVEVRDFAYSPAILHVNPHDRVTIQLVSADVVHGIYIDGYELEVSADPGQTASLSFVANRPGTFRFRCSVTCGALHPFMIGKLQVGRNELLWRAVGLAGLVAASAFWSRRK